MDKEASRCLSWIDKEQEALSAGSYGRNKQTVGVALTDARNRLHNVRQYRDKVERLSNSVKNDEEWRHLKDAYTNLKLLTEKRVGCVETLADISNVEDLFVDLVEDIADKGSSLVSRCIDHPPQPKVATKGVPHHAQSCILAVKDNWKWISRLVRCTDVHVKHVAEYHQYFHDVQEYDSWFPADGSKLDRLFVGEMRGGTRENAARLLAELKVVLTTFLTWQGKTDSMFERAKRVVPIHLRRRHIDHPTPVNALCHYWANEVEIREGEELLLLDNKRQHNWLVRTSAGKECFVPSIILLIPPPYSEAVNSALRLRLQVLGIWTSHVKRIGKVIISFLLQVFRDWITSEESVLRSLKAVQKDDIGKLCDFIELTLIKYWSGYPDFEVLQTRFRNMKAVMSREGDPRIAPDVGLSLVVQMDIVRDLIRRYKDLWTYWETYKILVETCRHSEMVLISGDWEKLKFIDTTELIKKWHISVDEPKIKPPVQKTIERKVDRIEDRTEERRVIEKERWRFEKPPEPVKTTHRVEEEVFINNSHQTELLPNGGDVDSDEIGSEIEGEVYNVETALETAAGQQISSAEQEERKTWVITGVVNPRDGKEIISLDDAVDRGIINQQAGIYTNIHTGATHPIQTAMNNGWIKMELKKWKKSEEKRSDIGLITIKTHSESRPYTVKGVKDLVTDRMMPVDDAVAAGLIDFKKNAYKNRLENTTITIADALDSGLLDVVIEDDAVVTKPKVDTKTYAIYAVIDQITKKKIPFGDAVKMGLIDPDTGAYNHNMRKEQIYVGDAIRHGYIKASVVKDPK